jgi:hypothetical protein
MGYFDIYLSGLKKRFPTKIKGLPWKNAYSDGLPRHNDVVLVSSRGETYTCRYDCFREIFISIDSENVMIFMDKDPRIFWTESAMRTENAG